MSFNDIFKSSFLENVTAVSLTDMALALVLSFCLGMFIYLVYKKTYAGVMFSRIFGGSLVAMTMITTMVILAVTSNVVLSLGMVGALSIVRFRTAVKDASDTSFLFWAVAAGITSGAGFYLLTLLGCLFVGLVCVVSMILFDRVAKPFLLVVRANEAEAAAQVDKLLEKSGMKYSLSSQVQNQSYTEVIYELAVPQKGTKLVAKVTEIPGITNVSLVDCRKG